MTNPSMTLLYVDDTAASAAFYGDLFGRAPTMASPNFASFVLDGYTLCLWSRHTAIPAPATTGGGSEVLFVVDSPAAVDDTFADWKQRGLAILQEPVTMDFGRTFLAADPDGHRLRVCLPDQ